jgi:hypothetical protein
MLECFVVLKNSKKRKKEIAENQKKEIVEKVVIETTTSALQRQHSNQLSYIPSFTAKFRMPLIKEYKMAFL